MTFDQWTEDDRPDCMFCHEPDCRCPPEPIYCLHKIAVSDYCPICAVAGEQALHDAFERKLREMQQRDDEDVGAGLAARFEGRS